MMLALLPRLAMIPKEAALSPLPLLLPMRTKMKLREMLQQFLQFSLASTPRVKMQRDPEFPQSL
jgi:hypothetical protein